MFRRIALLMIVLAACAVLAPAAHAEPEADRVDRLLQLLVKKQILTPEEAEALAREAAAPPQTQQAKQPAPLQNLKFKGFMHIAGYWRENGTAQNNDTFQIRQARLVAEGEPAPRYSFLISAGFEQRAAPILLDTAVRYRLSARASLTAGQFKLPVSHESIISGKDTDLIDRSQFVNQMRPENGRDIGVKLDRALSPDTNLELGVFNGSGKNNLDTGDPDALVARLTGSYTLGRVQLQPEAAYLHASGETGNATPLETAVNAAGFAPYDRILKHAGFRSRIGNYSFNTEFMQARFKSKSAAASSVIADGRYMQFGVDFMKRYTFLWRHEDYDPGKTAATASDITWDTFAINYKASKSVLYKLNYLSKKEAVGGDDNDELRLQVMIGF